MQEAKITYAINNMHDIAKQWIDADYDLRVRFQTMLFPEGATFDMATMEFGTEKISPLYRYIPNKKDLSESEKSLLVTHVDQTWHSLVEGLEQFDAAFDDLMLEEEA